MGLYTLRKEALGIEKAANWGLLVKPNPTMETITMKSELEIDTVEIIDLTGRHIQFKKNTNNQISVSDLPSGLYILKAFDKQSRVIGFKKIVKL